MGLFAAMATENTPDSLSVTSYDTALCLVPPKHLWSSVDRLRALYDKAFEKWPPHVNLVYPFVQPDALPRATERLQSVLSDKANDENDEHEDDKGYDSSFRLSLDDADVFTHKHENTIFLHDRNPENTQKLQRLRQKLLRALGAHAKSSYRMHLTVAQSQDVNSATHKSLLSKVSLLPSIDFEVDQLYILVRERLHVEGNATSRMRIWGTIELKDGSLSCPENPLPFYKQEQQAYDLGGADIAKRDQLQTNSTYFFDEETGLWLPCETARLDAQEIPETLAVSSYNVLAEFDWPPSEARYPLLLKNILSNRALADVLVLQEVTDGFLSYLLADQRIRDAYPFSSHGPPNQFDIEPLPNLLNMVVLSKWAFDWEHVSFQRKHKGSLVVKFKDIEIKCDGEKFLPLVLATVHLSHGLTDGAVAAKKNEIQRILKYLDTTYPNHPSIIAGDFNITTSINSINAALEKKNISPLTVTTLSSLDKLFSVSRFDDAWKVSRSLGAVDDTLSGATPWFDVEGRDGTTREDELFDGEQGATYDPLVNEVASAMVGNGSNMRPQRYDRVLVRGEGLLTIAAFNKFGFLKEPLPVEHDSVGSGDGTETKAVSGYASDHWGVRCVLRIGNEERPTAPGRTTVEELAKLVVPVHLEKAPKALSEPGSVKECLSDLDVLPSEEEIAERKEAFSLLKSILLDTPLSTTSQPTNANVRTQSSPPVIIVPAGSYALGVWTSASDMDILCIGPFSASTFFALATQRLRKATTTTKGTVKILRRVKANSGTMLELLVLGIKTDLQYCPAGSIAAHWPHVLATSALGSSSATAPSIWSNLAPQTLAKLKAVRDLDYLARSVPDLAAFRVAHRFIKTWARARGIYSARFGYLGGIQISILLARVYKMLAYGQFNYNSHSEGKDRDEDSEAEISSVSVPDLLSTFFHHYAVFDWKNKMAFDPFFHLMNQQRSTAPYARSAVREPLAILGYFPPALNTSHAASVHSVRALAEEFKRASAALSAISHQENDGAASWRTFLCGNTDSKSTTLLTTRGATDFLSSFKTYAKIDVQYWGLSPSRGAQFVGWLESRCVTLLVDLHRRAPGVYARIWPARFVEIDENDGRDHHHEKQEEEGVGAETTAMPRDYRGFYLIGLDKLDENADREKLKTALGGLQTALRRFEEQMRGDEKYFDARTCWIGSSVVNRSELGELEVDGREWGEYAVGEEESDEEEEEEDEEEHQPDDEEAEFAPKKRQNKKKGRNDQQELPVRLEPGKKFRTAADVMNRLRWDPELDSGDYVVGYEDRFLGPRERALDAWKTEQTDEEFIPQHRILYFKRATDGEVVWERKTRKDVVFGSGV